MKARMLTPEVVLTRATHAAVMRTILMVMLMQREVYGFGSTRMNRFIDHLNEYTEEYLYYDEGNIADEKLIQRLEKSGVPVNQQIKTELLSAEREAFRLGIGASQKGARR